MRIAVCHNQPTGGARRALHGFCRQLKARHWLDIFTLDTSDDEWLHDVDVARHVDRANFSRRRPIRFGLYLNDVIEVLNDRALESAYTSMAQRVDAGGYDVALVDVCRFSLVPSVLDHLQTPSVFYAHNGPAWLEGEAWGAPLNGWERARGHWHEPLIRARETSLAKRQRASVRAATLVATNSRHTADRLKRAYDVESVVCPPGVEVAAPGGGCRSPFVLSVGEIEPRKGFDFLIDAIGCLGPSTRPPLRILANRSNPTELSRLRKKAQRAGVDLEVQIAPRSDVLEWHYANARLFVYAAHSEPLGLAPLEAMAHGTPVVAVAEGGVCDTVRSGVTGFLVEREPHAFAECVKRLWDDATTLGVMRGAARAEVIERWDVNLRSERLEALLLSTAGAEVGSA